MEKPWIITHGDFMEFFCKGRQTHTDFIICPMLYSIAMGQITTTHWSPPKYFLLEPCRVYFWTEHVRHAIPPGLRQRAA